MKPEVRTCYHAADFSYGKLQNILDLIRHSLLKNPYVSGSRKKELEKELEENSRKKKPMNNRAAPG
jgi:hypothetical protein